MNGATRQGIQVVALDQGPGIRDVQQIQRIAQAVHDEARQLLFAARLAGSNVARDLGPRAGAVPRRDRLDPRSGREAIAGALEICSAPGEGTELLVDHSLKR